MIAEPGEEKREDFPGGNKPRKKRDLLLPGDPLPPRPCTQGQLTLTNI